MQSAVGPALLAQFGELPANSAVQSSMRLGTSFGSALCRYTHTNNCSSNRPVSLRKTVWQDDSAQAMLCSLLTLPADSATQVPGRNSPLQVSLPSPPLLEGLPEALRLSRQPGSGAPTTTNVSAIHCSFGACRKSLHTVAVCAVEVSPELQLGHLLQEAPILPWLPPRP